MKRAIKILLAFAVMVTTFVIVTVVASASEYVYADPGDYRPDYVYKPGDYSSDTGNQIVYLEYSSTCLYYEDLYFSSLARKPQSIVVGYIGLIFGDTEDCYLFPNDLESSLDVMGYDGFTLIYFYSYESYVYFDVYLVNSFSDIPGYDYPVPTPTPTPDPDPDPDPDPEPSLPSTGNNYNFITLMDGTSYIYCPDLAYRSYLGFVNRFLPVFFIEANVEYNDLFYDLYYYARQLGLSDIANNHHIDDMSTLFSDSIFFGLYGVENNMQVSFTEGQLYDGLTVGSSGTYVFSLSFPCHCSDCGKYYSEFWFCFYVLDSLPHVVDSEGDFDNGTVTGGYADGYNKGYDEGREYGYNEAYADAEYIVGNRKYKEGYNKGYDEGYKIGYDTGCDDASTLFSGNDTASYQQGYQDALETVIDTDGDAISGFFTGIAGSTISALDYITRNIRIGGIVLFDVVEFVLFIVFCYFVVKLLIRIFTN